MIELPIIPKLELSNTQERERVIQVLQADIDRVTAPHLKKLPQSHDHVTAEKIIEAAEKYGVSWTYVAAFARNDSNYGTLGY